MQSETKADSGHNLSRLRRIAIAQRAINIYAPPVGSGTIGESLSPLKIGEDIKKHMGLSCDVAIVTKTISTPGLMKQVGPDKYLIEISPKIIGRTDVIIYALAHEFTHVYLYEKRIHEKITIDNERLTDIQCIYLGFGKYMANSQHGIEFSGDMIHKMNYGYLSDEQISDEISRFAVLTSTESEFEGIPDLTAKILLIKRNMRMGWFWKIKKIALSMILSNGSGLMNCPCPVCEQNCRVPILIKTIRITCPTCRSKFLR